MSLYQVSVLKKHLKLQDQDKLNKAYKKYTKYFLNPTIQDNIRSSKEEEYQGIFLTELFVNVLDYTLKPKADFNLVAEYKNQNNARKADGAILNNDVAIGVIELKGTNTKDLESIRKQAFDYKANQKGCTYVITSNFEKLRFYINDATEFEEFNLFELPQERFELLYLCLQKDNVLNNIPLQIKEASIVVEEQITKQFYKDYSLFKRELSRDLVKRNSKQLKAQASLSLNTEEEQTEERQAELLQLEKNVKLTLFKKSQKLIDRFLFIFFAEDRGLLPPNSTQQILDKWKADVDFGDERPLYNLFKQYFKFLDQGRQGTNSRAEIYAYNGGLFKEDSLLDTLEIDNDLLHKYTQQLAGYDFESQVDVNILGHIFENSLNEIESVNAEIEGGDFDKQKSKRKKDGVFYTPKYITKYIVENTIGKLCDEKKVELKFKEEEYFKGRKNRNKSTITNLVATLDTYRDWLLQLTICDPACGSGAFLNQALDFLIKEHTYIDELKTKVLGGGLQFPDIENTILENNIYGVDLNEESVEIAKLSLWLRTAQPRRKLNDLSSNIKCGNSLIDNKAVAGDKAFNWQEQFPKVFRKGGFDVIIGNPPYVPTEYINTEDKIYLEKNYQSAFGRINLYPIFYEKGILLLREKGVLGFITPYTILKNRYYKSARNFILNESKIHTLIDFKGTLVFSDAAVDSIILILERSKSKYADFSQISNIVDFQSNLYTETKVLLNEILKTEDLSLVTSVFEKIIKRVSKNSLPMKEIVNFNQGIITGGNKKYITSVASELTKPVITGSDFNRYVLNNSNQLIIYDTDKLHRPRKKEIFEVPERLILRQTGAYPICTLEKQMHYTLDTVHNGLLLNDNFKIRYVLGLLNSKLFRFLYENSINETGKVFAQVKIMYVDPLPIKKANNTVQNEFSILIDSMLNINSLQSKIITTFLSFLTKQYILESISRKLKVWYELDFGDFIKELNKSVKTNNKLLVKDGLQEVPTLTKKDEFEWLELFEENKQKAQSLQTQINQTDKEIDAMVYKLYDLTEDEIIIVENN
jgi:type I restriction-modification system DNA methylase subunit